MRSESKPHQVSKLKADSISWTVHGRQLIKQGRFLGERDEVGDYSAWISFTGRVWCFEGKEDIDDLITLLQKLKATTETDKSG